MVRQLQRLEDLAQRILVAARQRFNQAAQHAEEAFNFLPLVGLHEFQVARPARVVLQRIATVADGQCREFADVGEHLMPAMPARAFLN